MSAVDGYVLRCLTHLPTLATVASEPCLAQGEAQVVLNAKPTPNLRDKSQGVVVRAKLHRERAPVEIAMSRSRIHFSRFDIFKSCAKKVHKAYTSNPDAPPPLTLAAIRSICAYAFGYRNDHDVLQSITANRHDDLALLSDDQYGAIRRRLTALSEQDGSVVGVKAATDWPSVVQRVSEALVQCLESIRIAAQPLLVMTVRFYWPFSPFKSDESAHLPIEPVLHTLQALSGHAWTFLPSCSFRGVAEYDEHYDYVEQYVEYEDLQRAMLKDNDARQQDVEAFITRFASDHADSQDSVHLLTGLQVGTLTFALPATLDPLEFEVMEIDLERSPELKSVLSTLIHTLMGERVDWVEIDKPCISYIDENEDYVDPFTCFLHGSLSQVANASSSPHTMKSIPLMTAGNIVGCIEFNDEKANIFLPNYDSILHLVPTGYNELTTMYAEANRNIDLHCRGLNTSVFAYPSDAVLSQDDMAYVEEFDLSNLDDTLEGLEGGALINNPRYLKGYHEPDFNPELMDTGDLEIIPGRSFLESSVSLIKPMQPTAMSAIAYIEAVGGDYFHVVASVYAGETLIAEESYSVYPNAAEEGYRNGMFSAGNALHDRLAKLAQELGVPFSATSMEERYLFDELGDMCFVFRGTDPSQAQINNRQGILLHVLQKGIQDAITDDQFDRLLACIKSGLVSTRYSNTDYIDNWLQWGIDKHPHFISKPYNMGIYGPYIERYTESLLSAPLVGSELNVQPLDFGDFDRCSDRQGPFCVGLAFDGPELIKQEIVLGWASMSDSPSAITNAFTGRVISPEQLEREQQEAIGAIPSFFRAMEKEIRDILNLAPEAQLKITFT